MARVRLIGALTSLAIAGASFCLLETSRLGGAAQEGSNAPPSAPAKRASSKQPTWHSGPATTPPQTEAVWPPSPFPPPAKLTLLRPPGEPKTASAGSGFATRHTSEAPAGQALTTNIQNYTSAPEPEAKRIQGELERLRDDAGARRAFYDDLLRTVEALRAGRRDENSTSGRPPSSLPDSPASRHTSGEPVNPPASNEPNESSPAKPEPPQASWPTGGGSIEGAAYLRVVRWARANGAPVPLALGVAWIESHLHTYPPRGAAGEVGMFQILPERCRLEGWPPSRLKEPEFNAWLGTLLLARYYQEEGNWGRAAAKYVAGPAVFQKSYSNTLWTFINWYASSVESYAGYFSRYQS